MEVAPELGLVVACALLFFGALVAGWLPFVLKVSEASLQVVAAAGAGLLVGTALAVVIPEGFEAFHNASDGAAGGLPAACSGAALVLGFLAMMLLDHAQKAALGGRAHIGHGHRHAEPPARDDMEEGKAASPLAKKHAVGGSEGGRNSPAGRALIGLVIHATADGLAVGAASASGSRALEGAVAAAMLLHKAPVAFGLSVYLICARWSWPQVRRALLVFAAASPLAALATHFVLSSLPALSSPAGIALAVLFSGGTFLHAACVHMLPDIMARPQAPSWTHMAALLAGSLAPIGLSAAMPHQ